MESLLNRPLAVDNVVLRNRVLLAPMSGVSDLPFRQLAWEAGAGMTVSEMVASNALNHGRAESLRRLESDGIPLCVVQLAGCRPQWMAEAARIAVDAGAGMIDINMGCPAKKVIGGYSGSALMRDPALAISLVEAVVQAVTVPVTLKMRLGWDETCLNASELARRAQDAGVKMITVHGRTRMQLYSGKADWHAVRAVREHISVPFVINGDIATREDALRAMKISDADAVMTGRASYGQPWLAGEIAGNRPPKQILDYVLAHYEAMLAHYGAANGMRHARKHLDWYLQRHCRGLYSADERTAIMTGTIPSEVRNRLGEIFARRVHGQDRAA